MDPAFQDPDSEGPPGFVQLAAHPLRWRLLRELTRSDRMVRELTDRLQEPQNLVSYHLRRLRDGGLVTVRRSAADGRDSYYAIDLERCEQELQQTGRALHPGLWPHPLPAPSAQRRRARRRRVLFLCTGNSARSQMAEALLDRTSAGSIDVMSAGSHPKRPHPEAVRAMRTRGIDISERRSKNLDQFTSQRFDLVITLCDRVRELCPEFPGMPQRLHWSMPDPTQEATGDQGARPAFQRTAAELEIRIRFLLPLLAHPPTTETRRPRHAER